MNIRKSFKFLIITLLVLTLVVSSGCKKKEKNKNDEQPFDYTDLSVRDYVGKNGVVAAANPYAAKAGLDILEAGGNAFDAAVAISFALGVCEPNASGLGGGGILVGYDAKNAKYVSYNFREFVPAAGTPEAYPNGDADVDDGIKSSGVPTQVAGLLKVEQDLGVKNRQEVLAPAIKYANEGVPVTPELAKTISDEFFKIIRSKKETKNVYTSDGIEPLKTGDMLIQKDYASVLQLISDKGLEGFYKGRVADAIVKTQTEQGGLITHEDLLYAMENYPIIETPILGTYRGYDIATANTPSSGGIILLEALNMLECYGDITALDHNSAEYLNVMATAMALAYGDKRKYIADSKFVNVPITGLTSKQYAATRWSCYTEGQAFLGRHADNEDKSLDYGDPWAFNGKGSTPVSFYDDDYNYIEHYSTTSFSVADKDGNICSVTQTINYFFGNGVVPEGCGFFMNNQLSSFSFTSGSVHNIVPYKQPVSHIMPTIIMKDGDPWATLGSPGGLRIPSAVFQVVVNLIDFGMDMQEAISSPRVYAYAAGSDDISLTSKDLYVEKAIPQNVRDMLKKMNYNVIPYGSGNIDLYFGGVQGIRFYPEEGKLHGGADPRRDGKALGY